MVIDIPRTLDDDIMNFVRLNDIKEINEFLTNCLRNGFNVAKYGYSPKDNFEKENKPFKINENEEEANIGRVEEKERKGNGGPKKESAAKKEESIEEKEVIKPKKKITIIRK